MPRAMASVRALCHILRGAIGGKLYALSHRDWMAREGASLGLHHRKHEGGHQESNSIPTLENSEITSDTLHSDSVPSA